jgi:hypothetical protein
MYYMHKKISARERIVGFYSTAAKIKPADLHLDALFRRLTYVHPDPILTLIDVRPDIEGLPVQAYQTVETVVDVRFSWPLSMVAKLYIIIWRAGQRERSQLCTHSL